MYCTQDCTCSLCRELRGCRPKIVLNGDRARNKKDRDAFKQHTQTGNDNFILRRRLSEFDGRTEEHDGDDEDVVHADQRHASPPLSAPKKKTQTNISGSSSHIQIDDQRVLRHTETSSPPLPPPNPNSVPSTITKARSCSDVWRRPDPQRSSARNPVDPATLTPPSKKIDQHKVIIYFGDSLSSKQQLQQAKSLHAGSAAAIERDELKVIEKEYHHTNIQIPAERNAATAAATSKLCTTQTPPRAKAEPSSQMIKQLQNVLKQKQNRVEGGEMSKPPIAIKPPQLAGNGTTRKAEVSKTADDGTTIESAQPAHTGLPSFIESIDHGVINLKIEASFNRAQNIVKSVFEAEATVEPIRHSYDSNDSFDWSFVQDWRSRPSGNSRTDLTQQFSQSSASPQSAAIRSPTSVLHMPSSTPTIPPGSPHIASSSSVPSLCRIQSPAIATPAPRVSKEVAQRLTASGPLPNQSIHSPNVKSSPGATQVRTSSSHLNLSHDETRAPSTPFTSNHALPIGSADASPSAASVQQSPTLMIPERDTGPIAIKSSSSASHAKLLTHRPMSGPPKLTIQSIPVKSQPAMVSSGLSSQHRVSSLATTCAPQKDHGNMSMVSSPKVGPSTSAKLSDKPILGNQTAQQQAPPLPILPADRMPTHLDHQAMGRNSSIGQPVGIRTHHHGGTHEFRGLHRLNECHSSSDENRSSGHASMSDTGHGSSSPAGHRSNEHLGPLPEDRLAAGVTNRSARSRASTGHNRPRHRGGAPAKVPWGGGGLEDIKLAIQQLTMRSQTSTSTYSSLSAGSESSEPARRLGRYSSLETVNTNVTSADEFVWVDSHNRLVELQHPPWSQHCVLRVIRGGRCREHSERISNEVVPRLGYLLQRALVRVAREVQRLSCGLGLCSKHEVAGAFKIVLCPALSDSCIKACLRAAAMFAVPGDSALRQSKSSRAGLQLPIGRFHRWMADARLGRFVHEYAAVYLSAGLENLLEEIVLQCIPTDGALPLTAAGLEHAIAASGDLWGLLQPYAHLNAGRIASGALTMPRWASQTSIGSHAGAPAPASNASMEPCLLTTCVGSTSELRDLVNRAQNKFNHTALSHAALIALFYFMRCSQLEHSDGTSTVNSGNNSIQELCYERAYVVLPPLVEWLRVATAHAEYRHSILIDKDDILQSARLLLPGVDCPPRPVSIEEELPSKKTVLPSQCVGSIPPQSAAGAATSAPAADDINEYGRRATLALAFRLMLSGRPELLMQASSLLPASTRYDTLNQLGMTALMVAVIRNDEPAIQMLLDVGADPNVEVPSVGAAGYSAIHPETQQWTAITFAACRGTYQTVRLLLERGGHVEGGARLSEDKCTLTPLQVASGSGCLEVVALLLAHGAHAFLSTQQKDSLCFSGTAQRGCYSPISVAAAHGQRTSLRKLLTHPLAQGTREVLSLEEMLAEGDGSTRGAVDRPTEASPPTLNKMQIKCLQEAMYHSAENNHLDITVELRALGVPWTLHCWMHALAAAHELRLDAVIDQLLQDFLQVCPDDYSSQFVSECLPLLFNIFRYSKKEGTTLLLADIFATCFGWETIKHIKEPILQPVNGSRIDPKFVNNSELSDVMFRVEGKIFYGHKIVLVTASPRFQSMLSSKLSDGTTPTVQINDIRYHIFQLVMQFLYSGGCNTLDVVSGDVLELMAAASFFQLDGLLRYTESRCSQMIDIDNVVAMYIHAKVYNAPKLMEYCQGFLLQNMVALLTYDDSVKRLLFAKKIPNHDVLSGLLGALQTRIKVRRATPNTPVFNAAAGGRPISSSTSSGGPLTKNTK